MDLAFMYAEKKAVMLESDYPYQAKQKHCRYHANKGKVLVKSFQDV